MAKLLDYPSVSSFTDNRGETRYRFRRTGRKTAYLPGQPHTQQFDEAYQAAVEGRMVPTAKVFGTRRIMHPSSLDAVWHKTQTTAKWTKLSPVSQKLYSDTVNEFLDNPMPGCKARVGDGPVADLKARHIVDVLDAWQGTPVKARILLIVLQKMMKVAIQQDWIDYDPTYGVDKPEHTPQSKKAWPPEVCARFELRWPIGTPARTAYELAKWLGVRRSDVALLRWEWLVTAIENGRAVDGFKFVQFKGRNLKSAFPKFHAISPMLAEALAPLDRTTGTVLAQPNGQPYRMGPLTCIMGRWCKQAGIETGYSFHGLRHAMGATAVDAGASPYEVMDLLGHATVAQGATYTKERNQAAQNIGATDKVTRLVRGG
jgi:integrase